MKDFLQKVNAANGEAEDRIEALKVLIDHLGELGFPQATAENHNHIHTIYSFSPYTPTIAAFIAKKSALSAVGSLDHDSISAATEMKTACDLLNMGCTTGFEARVNFKNTPYENKYLNNPQSLGIAYMTVQGIPSSAISQTREFLIPLQEARAERNRKMVDAFNQLLTKQYGKDILPILSYDEDVLSLSKANEDGSVTERHILCAIAIKLSKSYPSITKLLSILKERLKIALSLESEAFLSDSNNPHFIYDLIDVLKKSFLSQFFIQPNEYECLPVEKLTCFAHSIGAIPSYIHSDNTKQSHSPAKQKANLENFLLVLKELGFLAITFNPIATSKDHLLQVQQLCRKYEFMEIAGIDIYNARQSFNSPELKRAEFNHLIDATWALIAHEKLSSVNRDYGLFAMNNPLITQKLEQRIKIYADVGKNLSPVGTLSTDKALSHLSKKLNPLEQS
ncbi:MAG: PHP domain-containing protein [Treponemataceae bacterium]